jgi:hypothetical protein
MQVQKTTIAQADGQVQRVTIGEAVAAAHVQGPGALVCCKREPCTTRAHTHTNLGYYKICIRMQTNTCVHGEGAARVGGRRIPDFAGCRTCSNSLVGIDCRCKVIAIDSQNRLSHGRFQEIVHKISLMVQIFLR